MHLASAASYPTWGGGAGGSTAFVGANWVNTLGEIPPYLEENEIDRRSAYLIYKMLMGESPDIQEMNNLDSLNINQDYINYKPKGKIVNKVLGELKSVKVFGGGKEEKWKEVERLAKEWLQVAVKEKKVKKLSIKRVNKKYILRNYSHIAKSWSYRPNNGRYKEDMLAHDAYQVIKDAMKEMDDNKRGMASIEYDIIRSGGFLAGVYKNKVLVGFNTTGENVMDRLLDDGKEEVKPQKINPLVFGGGGGAGAPGMGGGGSNGWGGSGGGMSTIIGTTASPIWVSPSSGSGTYVSNNTVSYQGLGKAT